MIRFIYFFFALNIMSACTTQKIDLSVPIQAQDFIAKYNKDEKQFRKEYKKQIVLIEGRLDQYYRNKRGEISLILSNKRQNRGIKCNLIRSDRQIKKPLSIGKKIKVKGVCTYFNENIVLEDCFIQK